MIVNKRDLADVTGVSERTLSEWQKAGLPILNVGSRGQENEYDTAEVIKWMINREISRSRTQTPKDRLDSIRADEIELRLAERCGQLIDALEAETMWRTVITTARIELLAFVEGLKSDMKVKGIDVEEFNIDRSVSDVLTRLENPEDFNADESEDLEPEDTIEVEDESDWEDEGVA
jgi:terminase small subunit / prophage DNA-packing protein